MIISERNVEVTDEVAHKIAETVFSQLGEGRVCANDGRAMIAVVQSVLGPTLGMVTREECESLRAQVARMQSALSECREIVAWSMAN